MADPRRVAAVRGLIPYILVEAMLIIAGSLIIAHVFGPGAPKALGFGLIFVGFVIGAVGMFRLTSKMRTMDRGRN